MSDDSKNKSIINENEEGITKKENVINDKNKIASSADNVDQYLHDIEKKNIGNQQRQLTPEEQLFTEDELARLINPDKLKVLMENGDNLVGYLTGEIDRFKE